MVVGIVIGSGVFFKAQTVLQKTEGQHAARHPRMDHRRHDNDNLHPGLCRHGAALRKKVNGIVDYAEATVGKKYGYYIGWFLTTTYYPTLTSVLSWLSARYTLVFITSCWPDFPLIVPASEGGCIIGPECLALMLFYLVCAYVVNALSPKNLPVAPDLHHRYKAHPAVPDGSGRRYRRSCKPGAYAPEQLCDRRSLRERRRAAAGRRLRDVLCL